MSEFSRRTFVGSTLASVIAAGAAKSAPSDRVRIGLIGCGGISVSDCNAFLAHPESEIAVICDVDDARIAATAARIEKLRGKSPEAVKDFRRVVERKDIDVCLICTPDHWHALPTIAAFQAGKDVYVEKPLATSIAEGRSMCDAAARYNRIGQMGTHWRSADYFREAVEMVQSGKLGKVRQVRCTAYLDWIKDCGAPPDGPVPPGVDYDMWLGPAPLRPFNPNRFHFNFRWFWDYAGGLMTDWGVHLLDYGLIGMNMPIPKTVSALGGRFAYPDLFEETPDTLTTLYEFDGFNMVWDSALGIDNGPYGREHGIAYIGNNGTLILDRNGWEVIEESKNKNKVSKPLAKVTDNGVEEHWKNFIGVVKSRKFDDLHCPVQAAAHVATIAQMGNIAYRSGKKLEWNDAAAEFNEKAVNHEYWIKEYHNGYKLPKV